MKRTVKERIHFRLPADLLARLAQQAERQGLSRNAYVAMLLQHGLRAGLRFDQKVVARREPKPQSSLFD